MATPARQSDNQWVLGERRRDRSSKRKRGESITQASITRFVSPRAVSRRCISAGRPRGLRPLPFGTRVGTGSTLGEPSCFVADICCSDVAQEGMGGRSRTRSQKVSKQSEEFPQASSRCTERGGSKKCGVCGQELLKTAFPTSQWRKAGRATRKWALRYLW